MFAGGGSIPLEALRLGCESYAVELNPVAHIIELCTLVYPQKYGSSLVADVKKWGEWVIERAKAQLAEFYLSPQSEQQTYDAIVQSSFTGEQSSTQSNDTLTPVAYLWTRTVPCPNPTCSATVPLVRQTWLRKKEGNYIALRMTPDHDTKKVRFERVQSSTLEGLGFDPEAGSKRGNTVCLHCGASVNLDYIKQQGKAGRIGQQLMGVVTTRKESKGKSYFGNVREEENVPNSEHIFENITYLLEKEKIDLPVENLQDQDTLNIKLPLYGLTRFIDLFTPRQLLALLTFTAEVHHAHTAMFEERIEPERATAITTYLGLMVDRLADRNSTICHWDNAYEKTSNTYARQALPMVWDFSETNPFGDASGSATGALNWILEVIQNLSTSGQPSIVYRTSANQLPLREGIFDVVVTDPPYYDNVSYADLSDFFYVWLKRSIGFLFPEHFSTPLTPKKQEAVMAAYRHHKNKELAKQSYELMMAQAFSEAYRVLKPHAPLVCVYAHKTTIGWSTLIEALRHAGFIITEAWPIDTEMKGRSVSQGNASLASSIFLVARRRENEDTGDYLSQVRPQLISIINERLDTLIGAGLTGADLIIATIGAGLRAYTQFARVEMPNGDELDAATYLGEDENQRRNSEEIEDRLRQECGKAIGNERGAVVWPDDTHEVRDRLPEFQIVYLSPSWLDAHPDKEKQEHGMRRYIEQCGSTPRRYRNGLTLAVPERRMVEAIRNVVRLILTLELLQSQSKQRQLTPQQEAELAERKRNAENELKGGFSQLYPVVYTPQSVEYGGQTYKFDDLTVQSYSQAAQIHTRIKEALRNRVVWDSVQPSKLVSLTHMNELQPLERQYYPVAGLVSCFFSYYNWTHIWAHYRTLLHMTSLMPSLI